MKIIWRSVVILLLVACLVLGLQTPALAKLVDTPEGSIQPYEGDGI
jgi:hypothetical protein